jgi:hypothetical protein
MIHTPKESVMRNWIAVGLVALLAGCDWAPLSPWSDFDWGGDDMWWDTGWTQMEPYLRGDHDGFEQHSSLYAISTGVMLGDDGQNGVAGMSWATCQFETISGMINVDIDPDSEEEEDLDDGEDDDGNLIVLTTTSAGFQITEFQGWDGWVEDVISFPGIQEARFVDAGVAATRTVDGDCHVQWFPGSDVNMGRGSCSGLAVESSSGRVFVSVAGDLKVSTPDGTVSTIGDAAALMEWDPVTGLLYTATMNGTTVRALEDDGDVRWSTNVDGRVQSLEAMGDAAAVLVGLRTDNGGALVILDGATGAERNTAETTSAPRELAVSKDGTTIAALTDGNTHFIGVE